MTLSFPPATPLPPAVKTPSTGALRLPLGAFQRHLALWTLQAWLAMFFIGAAYAKLTAAPELLVILLGWPQGIEREIVRLIGAAELALGIGVLAPLLTWRLAPIMSASAIGLAGLAGFNLVLHLGRQEFGFVGLNLLLAGAALTVLVGRLKR